MKILRRPIRHVIAALGFAAAVSGVGLAGEREAHACGMSVRLEPTVKKSPVQEVARAEKALESGQNFVAVQAVFGALPTVRAATVGANALETRALRVVALAMVRSNGALDEKSIRGGKSDHPEANIAWAVRTLRDIDAKRPNDPAVQADLGEALAKSPATQEEAMKLLQNLAAKDLMGSPYAYAALASLRAQHGDADGALAAQKRCQEMSKTPAVCKPPAAKPSPTPKTTGATVLAKA